MTGFEKVSQLSTMYVEQSGGVARIVLNRPERRNALDIELFENLIEILDWIESNRTIRVVVLRAEGPVFCAGQNMKFTSSATFEQRIQYGVLNLAGRERIRKLRQPVVAQVQGHALGGGAYLVTACDISVVVRGSRLALREIFGGAQSGGSWLFNVGRARAMEASLLGHDVVAEQAAEWGLINRVVEADELDSVVDAFVNELLVLPPVALEVTKAAQNQLLDAAGFGSHLQNSLVWQRFLETTEDTKECRDAFVEKRDPVFRGR